MYKLSENTHYRNVAVYPKSGTVNVRRLDNKNNPIMTDNGVIGKATYPASFGQATGRQILPNPAKDSKGNIIHGWMEVRTKNSALGWVRYDLLTVVKPVSQIANGDGKALVENIIYRDAGTYHTLLYTQELISRLKRKGLNVAAHEKKQAEIVKSYAARRKKIQDSKMLKLEEFIKPGFEWLKKPFTVSGIGVIQFGWAGALAIAGLAIGVTTLALWNYFKTDAVASQFDLNACQTFAKFLETMQPETKDKILEEVQQQVQKGFEEGYAKGKSETPNITEGVQSFTNLGLVALAAYVVPKFF